MRSLRRLALPNHGFTATQLAPLFLLFRFEPSMISTLVLNHNNLGAGM